MTTPGRSLPLTGLAVVLAAAALAVAPQLIRGNSCGHDFDVHLASWLDCANAWRHGIIYPQWTSSPNWGAGEPRFVFYPPLTWMVGALLGLVVSWHFAPIVFTFLCLAGTGLATRALALEACEDATATLAGCAAIFSGFALFTAYERSAFPEFTGGIWLPLVVLFALRFPRHPARTGTIRQALDGSATPLALALAACWLSNAPLGVMGSYLLGAVALLASVLKKSWAPALRAAVATALALGLAAFYWIPAAWEQRWVDIRQATDDPGYNFENNWLFAHHSNPLLAVHDTVLQTASLLSVSMIAVALLGFAMAWGRGTVRIEKADRHWWIPLAAIPCAALFLLFPVSRPVWDLLPKFKFLQYPWRWMEAVEAPMAIFFAAALWPRSRRGRVAVAMVCAAGCIGATAYAATRFFQVCYPEDTVASALADFRTGAGFEGMYEYEPPQADIEQISMGLPDACLVSDAATALGKVDADSGNLVWAAGQNSCEATFPFSGGRATNPQHLRVRAQAPHAGFLVLRLLSYPAWRVTVNGNAAISLPRRSDGLMAVPLPAGAVDIRVDWTTTGDVLLGRAVSWLAVLALTSVCLLERKLGRAPVS